MTKLIQNDLESYAEKILNDYDLKTPGTIFKDDIKISNEDAWRIQSAVTYLRQKRGEKVIGYKNGIT
jgi:hypothetical protein